MRKQEDQSQNGFKSILKSYRKYRLKKYGTILSEILAYYGDLSDIHGKRILELGPGRHLNLLRFFKNETNAKIVFGVGKSFIWPWMKSEYRSLVHDSYILNFLKSQGSKKYDLIYSRYVMEEHSIDPIILLRSKIYWRYLKENRLANPDRYFPSSIPNMQAIFAEAYKHLSPGGILISEIAKMKNSALDDAFLEAFHWRSLKKRKIGRLSQVVSGVKR